MAKNGNMRGARMPGEHFERDEGKLNKTSNMKYAGEFSNPGDLQRSTEQLAAYAKKNKMKY